MSAERTPATGSIGTVPVADAAAARARAAGARLRMAMQTLILERRALMVSGPKRMLRALALASALFCVLFLILFLVAPLNREAPKRVVILPPERTMVLEEPKLELPPPPELAATAREQINVRKVPDPPALEAPEADPIPEPPALPAPKSRRREAAPKIDTEAAKAARERARTETAALARATSALDQSLGALSSALRSSGTGEESPRPARARGVRSGRSDGQLGAVENGLAGSGASADLAAKVEGSMVEIGALSPPRTEEVSAAPASPKTAAGPGVYRTNASLLAVIQKYAAGIQYCYENELKRQDGLKGKLVVALSVAASGAVLDATVVRNTLGSERLAACAVGQIKEWRFPPVPAGVTTFQAPFVFTPPN